jgi:DNA (cytosine-5)-methyltransferase 1
MTKTIATLFSGGGGFDVGAIAAGYKPIFGIDNNPNAVECYRQNIGDHIVLGDVRSHDYSNIKADHLHASPSCKTSSSANANKGETQFDIECADAVCRAIAEINPDTFSLENVEGYLRTDSCKKILNELWESEYKYNLEVLNAANYGVAQTRKRLIVMASRITKPFMPIATHHKTVNESIISFLPNDHPPKKWIGWYSAIADLIADLEESKLADWQLKALPEEIKDSFLMPDCSKARPYLPNEPSNTIVCGHSINNKVFLIHPTDQRTMPVRDGDEPCFTVTTNKGGNQIKALLLENTGARSDRPLQYRTADEPSWTVRAMGADSHWHKANVSERGKVLVINPRCLARFQSFPDWYILPDKKAVAGEIIGNAVPPLLAQRIMEAF